MSLVRLAWRNIAGSAFRSGAVFLCAALVASLALSATLVVHGAEDSLRQSLQRLGADIMVVPWATRTEEMTGARLMSTTTKRWMPRAYLKRIAAVRGVAAVSPQLYLATLRGDSCCAAPEVHLVAYDPASDFALRPWLEPGIGDTLGLGEAIAGNQVVGPQDGQSLTVYGYLLTLAGRLSSTGTGLDRSLFVTFETAQAMAERAHAQAPGALEVVPDSVSAVLVKVQARSDPHQVAVQIMEDVHGVIPVESASLFQTERSQMIGLLSSVLGLLAGIWALSMVFVGLAFSITANERRREIGVLRALGATPKFIFQSLLLEGVLLALAGGLAGITVATLAFSLFRDPIVQVLNLPFLFPAPPVLVGLATRALILTLVSVTLAALVPALRISRLDPAVAMRE